MGELFSHRWDFLPLITTESVDYDRASIGHIGGLTEARKIAVLAETYNLQMAMHGSPDLSPISHAANVHLDVSIPNFGIQELTEFPEEAQEVISGGPVVENGYLNVTDRPGLGTDVNEEKAAQTTFRRMYPPVVRRKDGSMHDW
jgi:mannonate dehydratase